MFKTLGTYALNTQPGVPSAFCTIFPSFAHTGAGVAWAGVEVGVDVHIAVGVAVGVPVGVGVK